MRTYIICFFMLAATLLAGQALASPAYDGESLQPPAFGLSKSDGSDKGMRKACKRALADRLHGKHRQVEKVEFDKKSLKTEKVSEAKGKLRGSGRYRSNGRDWRDFDFDCVYSYPQSRVVTVSVRQTGQGGDWHQPGHGDRHGRQACKREIEQQVSRERRSANDIRWDKRSVRERRESNNRISYQGYGSYRGGRGKYREFRFHCVYNQRKGKVIESRVDPL